jgi:phage terminase small subunit
MPAQEPQSGDDPALIPGKIEAAPVAGIAPSVPSDPMAVTHAMIGSIAAGVPVTPDDVAAVRRAGATLLPVFEEYFARYISLGYNWSESYRRAGREVDHEMLAALSGSQINDKSKTLAVMPRVRERVRSIQEQAAAETGVTTALVLGAYLDIATADPRELATFERVACRHCHDHQHRYQFTPAEMRAARLKHDAAQEKAKQPVSFDAQGGPHYDGRREPNDGCPECFGHGILQHRIGDLSKIGRKGLALLAGAKRTKEGLEVSMHDRAAAWDKLAKHIGFYEADKPPPPVIAMDARALDAVYEDAKAQARKGFSDTQGRMERVMALLEDRRASAELDGGEPA